MDFYSNNKEERVRIVEKIYKMITNDIDTGSSSNMAIYFRNDDTYIRKAAYQAVGKAFGEKRNRLKAIITALDMLSRHEDYHVRQSVINAAGEIGKKEFAAVQHFFDNGLMDEHHSPRNAVIGSVKKMGEVNPQPVLEWAQTYLKHPDKEIRREICHGIELRGRTHPEDILPLLKKLQHDKTFRVRNTLVHVIGQISYKKGCLAKVVKHLKKWDNEDLVEEALKEIIDVHHRYKNFSALTAEQAEEHISREMGR